MIPKVQYAIVSDAGVEERQAESDRDGHFQLHGVNLKNGVSAYHADYGGKEYHVDVRKGQGLPFDVDLKPIDRGTLRGTVRDPNGQVAGRRDRVRP